MIFSRTFRPFSEDLSSVAAVLGALYIFSAQATHAKGKR